MGKSVRGTTSNDPWLSAIKDDIPTPAATHTATATPSASKKSPAPAADPWLSAVSDDLKKKVGTTDGSNGAATSAPSPSSSEAQSPSTTDATGGQTIGNSTASQQAAPTPTPETFVPSTHSYVDQLLGKINNSPVRGDMASLPGTNAPANTAKSDEVVAQRNEAITNTALENLKRKRGVYDKKLPPPTKDEINTEKEAVTQAYNNNDIAPVKEGNKIVMKRTTGFAETALKGINEAYKADQENNYFASLSQDEKIRYLNTKQQAPDAFDQPDNSTTVGSKVDLSFGLTHDGINVDLGEFGKAINNVAGFGGENAGMLAKGAVGAVAMTEAAPIAAASSFGLIGTAGAGNFGSFLALANQFGKGGYTNLYQKTYYALKKQGLSDQEAADKANTAGLRGEMTQLGVGAALSTNIGGTTLPEAGIKAEFNVSGPPVDAAVKGLTKLIDKYVVPVANNEFVKIAGSSAAASLAESEAQSQAGVKLKTEDVLKDAVNKGGEGLITAFSFWGLHKAAQLATSVPSYIRPLMENLAASTPVEARETYLNKAVEQGIMTEEEKVKISKTVNQFGETKPAVNDLPIPEEKKAAITGKLVQVKKLEEQRDNLSKYGSSFNDKIGQIDAQISNIHEDINKMYGADDVFEHESDSLTGEKPTVKGEPENISQPIELNTEITSAIPINSNGENQTATTTGDSTGQATDTAKESQTLPSNESPTPQEAVVATAEIKPTVEGDKMQVPPEETKIVVHGTANGFELLHSQGVDKNKIERPKDARGVGNTHQENIELYKGNSIFNEGVNADGNKTVKVTTPMTDNFGRSGGAVYEITIPKDSSVTPKEVFETVKTKRDNWVRENILSDAKGHEVSKVVVDAVNELIDSKRNERKSENKPTVDESQLKEGWVRSMMENNDITRQEALDRLEKHNPEFVTLYRGEGDIVSLEDSTLPSHVKNTKGRWFTKDQKVAEDYAKAHNGKLYAVQVPKTFFENLSKEYNLDVTNGGEVLLPRTVADNKVDLTKDVNAVNESQAQSTEKPIVKGNEGTTVNNESQSPKESSPVETATGQDKQGAKQEKPVANKSTFDGIVEKYDEWKKATDELKSKKDNLTKKEIDGYVKKSGYKLIKEGDKVFGRDRPDAVGKYQKDIGGKVIIKTAEQISEDAIDNKIKSLKEPSKPTPKLKEYWDKIDASRQPVNQTNNSVANEASGGKAGTLEPATNAQDNSVTINTNNDASVSSEVPKQEVPKSSSEQEHARTSQEQNTEKPQADGGNSPVGSEGKKEKINSTTNEHKEPSTLRNLERDEAKMSESEKQKVSELRGEGNNSLPRLAAELSSISERHGGQTDPAAFSGQDRQRWELLQRELQVESNRSAKSKQDSNKEGDISGEGGVASNATGEVGSVNIGTEVQDKSRNVGGGGRNSAEEPRQVRAKDKKKVSRTKLSASIMSKADTIEKEGLLPSWLKVHLPEGTQQAGFGEKELTKAFTSAMRLTAKAIDGGAALVESINEGVEHLRGVFSDNKLPFDEAAIRKGLKSEVKKLLSGKPETEFTSVRKEKLKEIEGVKKEFEKRSPISWNETYDNALKKVQEAYPNKSLYDAVRSRVNEFVVRLNNKDLFNPTSEDIAVFNVFRNQTQKRINDIEGMDSANQIERLAAIAEFEPLQEDLMNVARVTNPNGEAGRAFGMHQSEVKLDPDYGLKIRRMELMKSKGGEKLTPEDLKQTQEKWEREKEIMKREQEVRDKAMRDDFDARLAELKSQSESKGSNKSNPQENKAKLTVDKRKSVADFMRKSADKLENFSRAKGIEGAEIAGVDIQKAIADGMRYVADKIEEGKIKIPDIIADAVVKYGKGNEDELRNHIKNELKNAGIDDDLLVNSRESSLDKIKEFSDANKATDITNDMVGKNLIRDFVNSHIGEVDQSEILNTAAKDLKKVLPDVNKKKLIEAYLKEGEFKQPTKKDLEGGMTEAKKQLASISKLTEDIEDLNGLKEIRQRSFSTEREKSEYEKKLFDEKNAKVNEIADRNAKIKEEHRKLEAERNRQIKRISELTDKKAQLEKGIIEKTKAAEKATDTPEIEKLKSEVASLTKGIREAEAKKQAAERKIESDRNKQIKEDNRKIEAEVNRQMAKVTALKEKQALLEKGIIEKRAKNQSAADTPEIEDLKKRNKELTDAIRKAEADKNEAARKVTSDRNKGINSDNSKLTTEINRQMRRVTELTERKEKLEQGIREKRTNTKKVDTPEIENLKEQVKKADDDLRKAESEKNRLDKEAQDRKDKIAELDANIKRAIADRDLIKTHKNKSPKQVDAEIEAKQRELKRAIRDNSSEERVQDKKLEDTKKKIVADIKQFERKIAEGDFEDRVPVKLRKEDAELIKLQKERELIQGEYRKMQDDYKEKNKSRLERVGDFVRSAYVATLIGHPKTLLKVGALAILRPMSEATSKLTFGKVFDSFFPGISEAAKRGGESSSILSVKKGFEAYLSRLGKDRIEAKYIKSEKEYTDAVKEHHDFKSEVSSIKSSYGENSSEYKNALKKLGRLKDNVNNKLLKAQSNIIYKFIGGSSFKDALGSFVNRSNEIERQFGKINKESLKEAVVNNPEHSDLENIVSTKFNQFQYILGFIGRSHSALKTFSGRFSFAAGFMARMEAAVGEGRDISKTDTMLEIAHESYIDWERGKYQQSNFISDKWNKLINSLEKGETGKSLGYSKVAKFILQSDVAITRVPVNVLHEAVMEYTLGAFRAISMAAKDISAIKKDLSEHGMNPDNIDFKAAMREQISQMDAERAASIARAFRKGGLGAGIYALALITGGVKFGIFPHLGQKKKKDERDLDAGELNPGQVQIGSMKMGEISSGVLDHIPALWPMFMGLGMAQSYNDQIQKGKTTAQAVGEAVKVHLQVIEGSIPQTKIISPTAVLTTMTQNVTKRMKDVGMMSDPNKFTDADLKSPAWQLLNDRGLKPPVVQSNNVKLPVSGNKPNRNMTLDEFNKFNDVRKSTVEKFINSAIKSNQKFSGKGMNGVDFYNVPINQMTSDQLKSKLKTWEGNASKVAKAKLLAKK